MRSPLRTSAAGGVSFAENVKRGPDEMLRGRCAAFAVRRSMFDFLPQRPSPSSPAIRLASTLSSPARGASLPFGLFPMKALPLLLVTLLLSACVSSPVEPRIASFSGDYIDARKFPAAKIQPVRRADLRVPVFLRERELDASTVVAFMVETDGSVSEIQIVRTTDQEFAEAVRESISGWQYLPPVIEGKPARVVVEETVEWRPRLRSAPRDLQ